MKFETPEEFAQLFDPCARGEFIGIEEAARIIASRDSALTAKVREECAGRAVIYADNHGDEIREGSFKGLKAAIVGKEVEE